MKILWIEDDYRRLKGLFRPLEKIGHAVDYASDYPSYVRMKNQAEYDLYVVDLILPQKEEGQFLSEKEFIENTGLKVVTEIAKTDKPIMIVTVVENPEVHSQLRSIPNVKSILNKGELFPSDFKSEVLKVMGIEENNAGHKE
jgi:DNA-binding response OmpR family regulator